MHRCQSLVLIFQLSNILEQRTLTPLSLNPNTVSKLNVVLSIKRELSN